MACDQESMMMHIMAEAEKAEEVKTVFEQLDKDNSGYLDADELKELIELSHPEAGPTLKRKYHSELVSSMVHGQGITLVEIMRSSYLQALMMDRTGSHASARAMATPQKVRSPSPGRPSSAFAERPSSPIQAGVEKRCLLTSPRRVGHTAAPPRPTSPRPSIVKLERHGFVPVGVEPEQLFIRAENLLDDGHESHNQWQEALELFFDAARLYLNGERFLAAAEAFERASDCLLKLGRKIEAADALYEGGRVAADKEPAKAVEILAEAGDLYLQQNRTKLAAQIFVQIAQIVENRGDLANAIDWNQKALEYLTTVDVAKQRHTVTLRVAKLFARLKMPLDAAETGENLVQYVRALQTADPLESPLHVSAVVAPLFLATLCRIATTSPQAVSVAQSHLAEYQKVDPRSKELDLLLSVCKASAMRQKEEISDAFDKYASLAGSIEPWMATVVQLIESKF
eukprot:TRINITY_DN1574_c0_g1_i1.p1 TRINITY_DN1574_c0_g1~~TRINITY_DN1574_c0_g1_i1.p1  ORF type:complete len:456 (+),score=74.40 TRINITY_DN1574_c0_g1_i1:521-1888(+)